MVSKNYKFTNSNRISIIDTSIANNIKAILLTSMRLQFEFYLPLCLDLPFWVTMYYAWSLFFFRILEILFLIVSVISAVSIQLNFGKQFRFYAVKQIFYDLQQSFQFIIIIFVVSNVLMHFTYKNEFLVVINTTKHFYNTYPTLQYHKM